MDLATALDLKSPDDVTETKFLALKALHAKKIKTLMLSLDGKDKEIAKLKVLGKDSRRTQMIQALRDKIRSMELVTDVIKEELSKKAEMSLEEVNEFVIRKTIAGPKRFRPLTREELENKVTDLEKRMAMKKSASSGGSVNGGGLDAKSVAASVAASEKSAATRKSRQRDENKEDGDTADNAEVDADADDNKSSANSNKNKSGSVSNAADTTRIIQLMEQIESLKLQLDVSEGAVELQKEEVSRLRERNQQLVAGEEEGDFANRQYREMRAAFDAVNEDLDACTRKLAEATEENMLLRSETDVQTEQQSMELDALHDQCERLLSHNSSLLERLGEMELEIDAAVAEKARAGTASASAEASEQAKLQQLQLTEKRLQKLKDQLRASEDRVAELTKENEQIALLTATLRDKNVIIRDLTRKQQEVRSLSPDKSLQQQQQQNQLRSDASVGSLTSAAGGGELSQYRKQIADLKDENKHLNQALAAAVMQQGAGGSANTEVVSCETALLTNLIDSVVSSPKNALLSSTAAVGQAAERLLKVLGSGSGSGSGSAEPSLIRRDKVVALLDYLEGSSGSATSEGKA